MKCCPICEADNSPDAKFCNQCGAGLQPTQPSPAPQTEPVKTTFTHESERKIVTTLFSDLTGYTALTERLDPEEVKEITGLIFNGVKEIVAKYEGFIDRLLGDGVLAFFGIPKAHEDDPVRALQAALEIHEFVKGLSSQYEGRIGVPLSMHSGINTGLVVTAEVDPEKGSQGVAGDAVNLAARLSSLAGPGEILVGEETVRRTRLRFVFQDLGSKRVKGKADPVAMFKLTSAKAQSPVQGRQVSSAMVGRDQELNRLELQVMKVVNGEGSVVNIIGEAGIGKSRLMAELRRREVMQKVTLLEGRAISIGRNLSFYPLIDLLKQWAGISEEDAESVALDKLDRTIRAIHPEEAEEILPFVATLMGMKLKGKYAERVQGIEGEALEKLIFKNLRELLIKGSERTPTVIVMEDLHWADTSSLLLLQSLFRLAEKYRILFISLFRPGYWQGEDRSMEKIGEVLPKRYVELTIQPLDQQAGEALIENLLDIQGLPYTLRQQIIERSGGNPFFIEEVVRSLIDDGAIIRVGGSFEVTDKINSVVVPPTINDVLIARIDRLEEKTRELVKVASVIGRNFFDRILKDVADSIEDIDTRLAYLKELQLIRDRLRMDELEYFFKHVLAQEAVYESTLLQQRKALHLKVAQSIERLFQERLREFYALLAFHYSKANDLEKAEEWLIKAGEEALRSSASSEALYYYQEAFRLYIEKYGEAADPEKLASFEKNIGLAYYYKGKWANAANFLDSVLQRWGAGSPGNQTALYVRLLSDLLRVIIAMYLPRIRAGKMPMSRDNEIFDLIFKRNTALIYIDTQRFACEVLAMFRRANKFEIAKIKNGTEVCVGPGGFFAYMGFFGISKRFLIHAGHTMNRTDIKDIIAYKWFECFFHVSAGSWKELPQFDDTAVVSAVRSGKFWEATLYVLYYGFVKASQGQFGEVELLINTLSDLASNYDHEVARLYVHMLKTDLLLKRLNVREAQSHAEDGISFTIEEGMAPFQTWFTGYKTMTQVMMNEVEPAAGSLSQAEELVAKQGYVMPVILLPYQLARFLMCLQGLEKSAFRGRQWIPSMVIKESSRSAQSALRTAKRYAPGRTNILRLIGLHYWLIDKQGKAVNWWQNSIQEGERFGARPDLARTYLEVGKRLLEPQSKYRELNGITANDYLAKAEKLFREMDLQWDLEQLERVRAGQQN